MSTPLDVQPMDRCPMEDLHITPNKNIMFQFQVCHYSYLNVLKKKTNISFRVKPGSDRLQSAGSKSLFYPISIMLQIFTEYSVIL